MSDIDSELKQVSNGDEIPFERLIELFEENLENPLFNRLVQLSDKFNNYENSKYDETLLRNVLKRYFLIYYFRERYGLDVDNDENGERYAVSFNPKLWECESILFCSLTNCSCFFYVESISLLRTFIEMAMKTVYELEFGNDIPKNFKPVKQGNISLSRGIMGGLLDKTIVSPEEYGHIIRLHDELSELIHRETTEIGLLLDSAKLLKKPDSEEEATKTVFDKISIFCHGFKEEKFKEWANKFCEVVESCYFILSDKFYIK